ncbi:MAG: hypothetical protein E7459_02720 [Ruminococcaceae bacterium]|nr:hypothetical protein [Oscillospiraceae bacterium]
MEEYHERKEKNYPSLRPNRSLILLSAGLLLTFLVAAVWSAFAGACGVAVLFLLGSLLSVVICDDGMTKLVLMPDGIEVRRPGRKPELLSAGQLHLILAESQPSRRVSGLPMLYLSTYGLEELIWLQTQELKRQKLSPEAISARKQQPEWRKTFAKTYLHRHSQKGFPGRNRKIYCLRNTIDNSCILRHCYPHMHPVSLLTHKSWSPHGGATSGVFFRGEKQAAIGRELLSVVVVMGILSALLVAIVPETWYLGLCPAGVLMLTLYVVARKENEQIQAEPEGIFVSQRKKQAISAGAIKTIARVRGLKAGAVADYLVVSPLSRDEVALRERKHLRRSIGGRKFMATYSAIDDWETCCFFRWWGRKLSRQSYWQREALVVMYHPERARQLRRLYPHAQYLESPDGVW